MEHGNSDNSISNPELSQQPALEQDRLLGDPKNSVATKRHPWRWLFALAVIGLVIVAIVKGVQKGRADAASKIEASADRHDQNGDSAPRPIGYYVRALGTVTPLATVDLYSQITGRVEAVHYVEGQMVHRGDPLIDVDPRPYEAQLKEAQGTLQRDRGVLAQAEMDLARYKDASAQQAISRQTYEDQIQSVEQDRGTIQNDIGQVEYAQVQLSYCHLSSPINGRVGLRLIDPG